MSSTVNIAAINDSIAEGLHFGTITHAISTSDPNYSGLSISDRLVAISDNDVPKVRITEEAGKTDVTEGGGFDSYTIVLDTQPAETVTVTLSVSDQRMLVSPTTLTFTPTNWNVTQAVSLTATNDGIEQTLTLATITHAASSTNPNYSGISINQVVASIFDFAAVALGRSPLGLTNRSLRVKTPRIKPLRFGIPAAAL